jgi:hypothetical protein
MGEFQNVDALTLLETFPIINAILATRTKEGKNISQNEYALLVSFIELSI